MEKENWLFRLLWRFNAIAIAAVGLAGILAVGAFVVNDLSWRQPVPDAPATFVAVQKTKSVTVTYALGEHTTLDGTPYVMVDLKRTTLITGQELRLCSGRCPDREEAVVNYLLVDGRNATSHWLSPGTDHIVWHHELRVAAPASDTSHETVTGVLIGSRPSVPDEHGESKAGVESLYFFPLGDFVPKKFFSADDIESVNQIDRNTILIIYRNGGTEGTVSFSVPALKKLGDASIPKVQ